MKCLKFIGKILLGIVIMVLVILFIDYVRINIFYFINKNSYEESFLVYGNKNKYTPQGLSYSKKYNIVLETSYNSKHKESMLYVIDYDKGNLIKELILKDNYYHVGGITTNDDVVWISNDYEVNEYSLEDIINTSDSYISPNKTFKLPTRGDFACFHNNILWIGDFFLNPFYPVPDNNPLMMGYKVKDSINYQEPDYVVSLPKMIQGLAITDDDRFVVTSSFTYLINSNLSIYSNVLDNMDGYYELNNKNIPYYKMDKLDKTIKLPPMAEGLFYKDNSVYILFENSSDTYSYALPKMNKVIRLEI